MERNTAAVWSTEDKRLLFSRPGTELCSLKVKAKVSQASGNKLFSEEMQLDLNGVKRVSNQWISILNTERAALTIHCRCEVWMKCHLWLLWADGYSKWWRKHLWFGAVWNIFQVSMSLSNAVNFRPNQNTVYVCVFLQKDEWLAATLTIGLASLLIEKKVFYHLKWSESTEIPCK